MDLKWINCNDTRWLGLVQNSFQRQVMMVTMKFWIPQHNYFSGQSNGHYIDKVTITTLGTQIINKTKHIDQRFENKDDMKQVVL